MDDKTKVKILLSTLAVSSAVLAYDIYVTIHNRGPRKRLLERLHLAEEQIGDYRMYIHKILEVTEPSEYQLEQINRRYDFAKWDSSLKKS